MPTIATRLDDVLATISCRTASSWRNSGMTSTNQSVISAVRTGSSVSMARATSAMTASTSAYIKRQ